ncbi:MAG: hypothetical protein NUV82_02405 [Candidatus Komeilibacteria bacterium]|nr:hypothetical protein [Candidatus Komeilibacteria bacterium]
MIDPIKYYREWPVHKQLRHDRLLLYLWPLFATGLSLWWSAEFFTSLLLFFGLPLLYLCFQNPLKIKKTILFSLSTLVIVIVLDYICVATGIWLVENSVIGFRLLGYVTIENIIWLPIYTMFIIMFYEYFYEYGDTDYSYRPRLKYLYILFGVILLGFLLIYFINEQWLYINYWYLKFGVILVLLPIILTLSTKPKLFNKFLKVGVYFFYSSFLYEITALHLNQWVFPGGGIVGRFSLGQMWFPIEELFFWMILGAMGILSYYEFFDDDGK